MKTEHDIQNEIRLALSHNGFCVFRINSGKVKMEDGRWFDTNIPVGFSDLFAVKNGKAYFIEVKRVDGHASINQLNFLDTMHNRYGCRSGIARSVEDAYKICEVIK